MKIKRTSHTSPETTSLLNDWRQERAFRVVYAMSRIGLILSFLTSLVDLIFETPGLTLMGDVGLLLGFALSVLLSKGISKHKDWAWIPLFAGLWLGCATSLITTGGLQSPFNGSYWTMMYLGGLLIQVRFRPWAVTLFVALNLAVLAGFEKLFPDVVRMYHSPPPLAFVFIVNALVLMALFFFVSEFLKTERDLGQELLRRYKELSRTKQDLSKQEEANAAKSTFLANVSHELRTPLGAILGYAELMQAADIEPTQKEKFAETIYRNGNQLSKLVDDLLDLSKAEAGKIELESFEFNLKLALNEVIELLSLSARQKGISLEADYQGPLPETMVTDPLRFKQILRNIIGNAIKFTDKGSVRLIVSTQSKADLGSFLQIQVEDTGCGLTTEEQAKLFKAFTQADPSVTRKFGGSGLGLSLSQSLAKILGGELRLAWSEKDVGSCFVLQLPLQDLPARKHIESIQSFFTLS